MLLLLHCTLTIVHGTTSETWHAAEAHQHEHVQICTVLSCCCWSRDVCADPYFFAAMHAHGCRAAIILAAASRHVSPHGAAVLCSRPAQPVQCCPRTQQAAPGSSAGAQQHQGQAKVGAGRQHGAIPHQPWPAYEQH